MPSNVLVSGAGVPEVDGLYTYRGESGGKPYYNLVGYEDSISIRSVYWDVDAWIISSESESSVYYRPEFIDYPWSTGSEPWTGIAEFEPVPSVTEAPSQPTFGLPADVVALITSRFGSVANFLRLRNLGYI